MADRFSRRTLLRWGGATTGAAALASTAGCLRLTSNQSGSASTEPDTESPGSTSTEPDTESPGSTFAAWLPEPDALGTETYGFGRFDTEEWLAAEEHFSSVYSASGTADSGEALDLDPDDITESVYAGPVSLLHAEFDRSSVVDGLEDEGFDPDRETGGYTILAAENSDKAFAVGDGTVLFSNSYWPYEGEMADALETVIETKAGDEARFVDENVDMSTLVDALKTDSLPADWPAMARGKVVTESTDDPESGSFEGKVAEGDTATFDGKTTTREWLVLYKDEGDVDLDDLRTWVETDKDKGENSYSVFEDVEDIEYRKSGRIGWITGTIDTDDFA